LPGPKWEKVPGAAVRIAVGPKNDPWIVTSTNAIYHYEGGKWVGIKGQTATDIGVGKDGTVWIITNDKPGEYGNPSHGGNAIRKFNGSEWEQVDGGAVALSVDAEGYPWLVTGNKDIYRHK